MSDKQMKGVLVSSIALSIVLILYIIWAITNGWYFGIIFAAVFAISPIRGIMKYRKAKNAKEQ